MNRRASLALMSLFFIMQSTTACVGYRSALGFRSRQAVLRGDVEAFQELMEEAADTDPIGPLDNPKKTVLTHFLDLAADSRFFAYIDEWRKEGWIPVDMSCPIYRAHYRHNIDDNPEAADASARVCVDLARKAARTPDRSWEVKLCLEEAPFLVDTSTTALVPYLQLAADPAEPLRFRVGLLDGMTRVYITGAARRLGNEPSLSREEAAAITRDKARAQRTRIEWIVAAMRPHVDATLLAGSTARGVLEVENALVPLGESYVGPLALSSDPYENDLAWGWVRVIKNRKKIRRIAGLGLWNRDKETKKDVFWYLCWQPPVRRAAGDSGAVLGPLNQVNAMSLRSAVRLTDLEQTRQTHCKDADGRLYPEILGPLPLETTARATLTASVAASLGDGATTTVRLRKRLML